MHKDLNDFIEKSIHAGYGFALWHLPGDDGLNAVIETSKQAGEIQNFGELVNATGFVFAPFVKTEQHPIIVIKPDFLLSGVEEIVCFSQKLPDPVAHKKANAVEAPQSTTKAHYLQSCNLLIDRIKNQEAKKVVFSKIKITKPAVDLSLAEIFLKLKKNYPAAFTYLFYTPQTGLWMGASPETLLRVEDRNFHTMALAGTRPVSSGEKTPDSWPEKERMEQQWVSDFIEEELKKLGIENYSTSETYTSPAGAIEHIRTDFKIDNRKSKISLGKLIEALHPTPAVCGFQKDIALKMILEIENHDREYYTGFLGPLNIAGQNQLFVNLRCMKKNGEYFHLFTGGGITADSCADSEWQETEMKAAILEKVLI